MVVPKAPAPGADPQGSGDESAGPPTEMTSAPQTPAVTPERPRRLRWLLPALAILGFLAVAGPLGSLAVKASEVQKNDNAAFLPETAEATRVQRMLPAFAGADSLSAVVVYRRGSGLTDTDRVAIDDDVLAINKQLAPVLSAPAIGPVTSDDGQAAEILLQFRGSDIRSRERDVAWVRTVVSDTPGLTAHVTGAAGVLADLFDAFAGINGILLGVTVAVIALILIVVYRSPLLPLVVLGCAGTALGVTNGLVYLLASHDLITVSGQTQGILDVLVLGAGTDYALLLVARFREELRRHSSRHDAMRVAWGVSLEPILASGGTVILGLLCLLLSDLAGNRSLGPVTAIGITCALLSMLVLLPAVLALLGRAAFWPFRPGYGSDSTQRPSAWARVASLVGRRPRWVWGATVLFLVACAAGLVRLDATGIPQTDAFLKQVDSKAGQELLSRHFPGGTGSPAVIVARAEHLAPVMAAAQRVRGVAQVVPYTGSGGRGAADDLTGWAPKVVSGLVRIDATLAMLPDSPAAGETVDHLRLAVHAVPGAQAIVGGPTAANLDVQHASQRDRTMIIPLILGVVLVILVLLLRSIVAPLLLVGTVVLSFLATLGTCGLVFRDVFGMGGEDSSFPLYAFVFLVALGVDYNIFLMTRVREEVARTGHRAGTLAGLEVTGGVITSAGVVLAATFGALAVLPLAFMVQIAFAVALGVLLDTFVVRSLLVPALTVDLGRVAWWPGRLRRAAP